MTKTGWYNRNKTGNTPKYEAHRHSLASRGIKTSAPKGVKGVSSAFSPTPNFDRVQNSTDMCLADYTKILGNLGFHGKDRVIHKDHAHINIYGNWHKVEKGTIRELGKLHKAINDIEAKLGLTAPIGKETISSFGGSKATNKGLKKLEKIPFVKKGFAKKYQGKSVGIVFMNVLDKIPYGKNLTRENAIMYADMVIAKDALKQLKAWEVKKLMQFSMEETPQRKTSLKEKVSKMPDEEYAKHKAYMDRTLYHSGRYQNRKRNATPTERKKYAYEGRELRRKINDLLYVTKKTKDERGLYDKKALSIVVLGSKMKHLDFLEGKTRWSAIGDWKGFEKEKNVVLDIEYIDNKSNEYTPKLMDLLAQYNHAIIGEQMLYSRVTDIQDSTYEPED